MHPSQASSFQRLAGPLGLLGFTLAGVLALGSIGLGREDVPISAALLTVVTLLPAAAVPAVVYLLAAMGLGRPIVRALVRGSVHAHWHQLGLGLAAMLVLSHLLGVLGLLAGPGPESRIVGWAVVGVGLALLGDQVVRGSLRPERWPVIPSGVVLAAPALAVLLVAAINPPGWLWRSEFGAFDALSYHLQLPKEWAAGPRLWPVEHNVYSFLPSYVEAAFLHLGAITTVASPPGPVGDPVAAGALRMVAGEGLWILSTHLLHAGMAIIAALVTGRTAAALTARLRGCDLGERAPRAAGVLAGVLVLATPWTVVVSSLAYNEAAVMALLAAGMLAAVDPAFTPGKRGLAVGALIGVACGAKPTALFLAGPTAGLLLLANTHGRSRLRAVGLGSIAGVAVVLPWLVRNALASGNPVFPFASGLFGHGHWTPDQVARFASAHGGDGPILGRIAMLFSERGVLHPQWALALPLVVVAGIVALVGRASHRTAALLLAGVGAGLVAWVLFTHQQSRFLLPLLPPAALLFGIAAVGGAARTPRRSGVFVGVAASALIVTSLVTVTLFARDNDGAPNATLISNVAGFTGMGLDRQIREVPAPERLRFFQEVASPTAFVNLALRPQEAAPEASGPRVYLLGDSTPLYSLAALGGSSASRVVYHTTWDRSPLGTLIRAHPDDPAAWTAGLVGEHRFTHLLVNFAELERLVNVDRYYDPAVTAEAVRRLLETPVDSGPGTGRWRILRSWVRPGDPPLPVQALFEFAPAPSPARETGGSR
jgi:hypothetical protein